MYLLRGDLGAGRGVKELPKDLERLRADEPFPVRGDIEHWPRPHTIRRGRLVISLDGAKMLVRLHAVLERRRVEAQILSEPGQRGAQISSRIDLVLANIQRLAHRPEPALVGGAFGGLCGSDRLF